MFEEITLDLPVWSCGRCKSKHSIQEWDKSTLKTFNNRMARREYKSLRTEMCRGNGSKRFFVCPTCGGHIQGYDIKEEI